MRGQAKGAGWIYRERTRLSTRSRRPARGRAAIAAVTSSIGAMPSTACTRRLAAGSRAAAAPSAPRRPASRAATVSALSSLRRTNSVLPHTSHTPGTLVGLKRVVVAGAALRAGEPPGDPFDQRRLVDLDLDHRIELEAALAPACASSASACAVVRGKPSRMKPSAQSGWSIRSATMRVDDVVGDELARPP